MNDNKKCRLVDGEKVAGRPCRELVIQLRSDRLSRQLLSVERFCNESAHEYYVLQIISLLDI